MLEITTFVVTPFAQNMRLIVDSQSRQALVVDPGGETQRIVKSLTENDTTVVGIFLTHAHIDHGAGVARLLTELQQFHKNKPPLMAHKEGRDLRRSLEQQALMFGVTDGSVENVPEPDLTIADGDTVSIGNTQGTAIFTPGHAPDHLSLYFPNCSYRLLGDCNNPGEFNSPVLIAGDTLFAGSIGRTDLPGGNHEQLLSSIIEKLFVLPTDTAVLSGHGPDTTIGREVKTNPFF